MAGIAHEINNPLTGILMYASLLARDTRLDPGLQGDLAIIVRETHRCSNIVRELLNFSRESLPDKTPGSVNRVMDFSLALVENQAYFHNIQITRLYDPQIPAIPMDSAQIQQVFLNILVNASQAMPEGGKLTIQTGVDPQTEEVFIWIGDTGCGIPPENLEKIFDPFFSTKGHQGTGLGLSVSYGIIENHGGRIEVESEPGVGTVFQIRLPIRFVGEPRAEVRKGEGTLMPEDTGAGMTPARPAAEAEIAAAMTPLFALIYSPRFSEYSYGTEHPFKVQRYRLTFELVRELGLLSPPVRVVDCPLRAGSRALFLPPAGLSRYTAGIQPGCGWPGQLPLWPRRRRKSGFPRTLRLVPAGLRRDPGGGTAGSG